MPGHGKVCLIDLEICCLNGIILLIHMSEMMGLCSLSEKEIGCVFDDN